MTGQPLSPTNQGETANHARPFKQFAVLRRLFTDSSRGQFLRFPVAVALVALGAALLVSGVVDVFEEAEVSAEYILLGAVFAALGWVEVRRVGRVDVASAPAVLTMVTVLWITLALGSALAHLVADATNALDTAVFEGMATASTTAMTALDADSLPMGVHMFRALIQWFGGLSALIMAVIVMPLVLGGREFDGRGQSRTKHRTLITRRTDGIHRVPAIYAGFTVLVMLAFVVAGLGVFDAVAHALTTVSTGGLSTRTGSLAAFHQETVEWVAAVAMAIAGTSIGVVWWVIRGDLKPVRRSTEFRIYASAMGLAILALWLAADATSGGAVRQAVLTVTSAMSTTGFTTTDWGALDNGPQALLLVLIAIGAMSGSAGGGFRYIRMIEAFRFANRELKHQLHPNAVSVVRLNRRAVSERSLENLTGYIVVFLMIVTTGAIVISLGADAMAPETAITLSISALSTAGPQLGEPVDLAELGALSKLALATLMLLGRLSIYAVILTVSNVAARLMHPAITSPRQAR